MEARQTSHSIEAGRIEPGYWRELWQRRELLLILAWQQLQLRNRQTTAGALWTLLRPVLLALILSGVFGGIARLSSGNVPYFLIVLTGIAPWMLVSGIVSSCCYSVSQSGSLISKIYFPRILLPLSTIAPHLVDFAVICALAGASMAFGGIAPPARVAWLPLGSALLIAVALAAGVWAAALNARSRDLGIALPFLLQLGMFASPVGFSSEQVPEQWRPLYALNPMVGLIDLFRHLTLADAPAPSAASLLVSIGTALVLGGTGLSYFRSHERSFADHV